MSTMQKAALAAGFAITAAGLGACASDGYYGPYDGYHSFRADIYGHDRYYYDGDYYRGHKRHHRRHDHHHGRHHGRHW